MTPSLLVFVLLLEGFTTISVEILAIRQLIPFVGNSVVVTSLVIGVFLLFLSLGYFRGGYHRLDFEKKLASNFFIAALLIGIGLSFHFLAFFFLYTAKFLTHHSLIILSLWLGLVISPIVYLLGQTIPITTNLFNQNQLISKISGTALFINTLGSFLGAVLTSLLLLNFLGVGLTVFLNFLFLTSLYLVMKRKYLGINQFLLCMGLTLFIYSLNVSLEQTLFVKTNNYGNYRVEEKDELRRFDVNLAAMSTITSQHKAASYVEKIKKLLFKDLKLSHQTILVIGAGGFTLSAEGLFDNQVTYLDIDKQIKQIAESYFLKEPIKGRFLASDARAYFNHTKKHFDVIISDTYKNRNSLPSSLLTQEYFLQIKSHLNPGGLAIFNLIANPFLEGRFSKTLDNTLTSVFKSCMKIPEQFDTKLTNIVYVCKQTSSESLSRVYLDNLNSATLDQHLEKTF